MRAFVLLLVVFFPFLTLAQSACNNPLAPTTIYSSQGKTITYYVPHNSDGCERSMEGCVTTSCRGLDAKKSRLPTCLDAVRMGDAKYVTVASDPSNYGKYYNLGTITYRSALDQQMYTVKDVVGYVHDTGGAFKGRPDKLDVCTTVCLTCSDAQASALAAGNNVGIIRSAQGAYDPVQSGSGLGGLAGLAGSPFGLSSSAYGSTGGAYGGYPANVSTGGAGASPTQNPSTPMSVGTQQLGAANPVPTFVAKGRSAGTIIVQPEQAKKGETVRVSWSSVNMEPFSCVVKASGADFATGNEASKPYQIPTSASNAVLFTMRCVAADGSVRESTAAVLVQ